MEPSIFTAADGSVMVTLHNRFVVDVKDLDWLSLLGRFPLALDR